MIEGCQRWREGHSCLRPAREIVDTKAFDVAEIDRVPAKKFVTRHHYSKKFPADAFRFGLYQRAELVGVAVFSRPFTPAVITNSFPTFASSLEGVELGRFVLLDQVGANAETWFLSRCFAALRDRVRGVVSFSDPLARTTLAGVEIFPGHVGTIYQASNARYLGTSAPSIVRILPDGTAFSNFASGKIRRKQRGWRRCAAELVRFGAEYLDDEAPTAERIDWLDYWRDALTRPVRHPGLHRYTFTLDRDVPASYGPLRANPKRTAVAA